jgi:hypothetical protein
MKKLVNPVDGMSDDELDAQIEKVIRTMHDLGVVQVRRIIRDLFPDIPEERLQASTGRMAKIGFSMSSIESWKALRDR